VVDGKALRLLGRHIGDGSHDAAVLGDGLGRAGGVVLVLGEVGPQLGEAEVEDLHPALGSEHHVLGLEVTVEDPVLVRGRHRVGEGDRDREEPVEGQPSLGDRARERLALDVLHREETVAVGLLDRVQGHDAGVVEGGDRPGLALEPLDLVRVLRGLRRKELEGHPPAQPGVLGEVDLSHPPRPEGSEEPIAAQGPAGQSIRRPVLAHDVKYDERSRAEDPAVTSLDSVQGAERAASSVPLGGFSQNPPRMVR